MATLITAATAATTSAAFVLGGEAKIISDPLQKPLKSSG